MTRNALPLILASALAGCASNGVITDERIVEVSKPVAQPCIAESGRPPPVTSLKEKYPDWYDRDVRQKSAIVGLQTEEYAAFGEDLNAATGACK